MRDKLIEIFQRTSAYRRIPRHVVASVELGDWNDLADAKSWCEEMFAKHGKQYLPHINVGLETALFKFADEQHAIEFKLRYG